jgi:hypothetical protein
MIPIPAIIYNRITSPFQFLASRVAECLFHTAEGLAIRMGHAILASFHQIVNGIDKVLHAKP